MRKARWREHLPGLVDDFGVVEDVNMCKIRIGANSGPRCPRSPMADRSYAVEASRPDRDVEGVVSTVRRWLDMDAAKPGDEAAVER